MLIANSIFLASRSKWSHAAIIVRNPSQAVKDAYKVDHYRKQIQELVNIYNIGCFFQSYIILFMNDTGGRFLRSNFRF
jgi:hypothetical protein